MGHISSYYSTSPHPTISHKIKFQERAKFSSQWRGRNEKQKLSPNTKLYNEFEENLRIRQVQSRTLPNNLLFRAGLFAVIWGSEDKSLQ
jgi:hypothetical protein